MIRPTAEPASDTDRGVIPVVCHRWFKNGADWAYHSAYKGMVLEVATLLKSEVQNRTASFGVRWREGYLLGMQWEDGAGLSAESKGRSPAVLLAAYVTYRDEAAFLRSRPGRAIPPSQQGWKPGRDFSDWIANGLAGYVPDEHGIDDKLKVAPPKPLAPPPPMVGRAPGAAPEPSEPKKSRGWLSWKRSIPEPSWTPDELARELESTWSKILRYWSDEPLRPFLADDWYGVGATGSVSVAGDRPPTRETFQPFAALVSGTLSARFVREGLLLVVGRVETKEAGHAGQSVHAVHTFAFRPSLGYWQLTSVVHQHRAASAASSRASARDSEL